MPARESRHKKFLVKVPIIKLLSEKFKQDLLVETGLAESGKEISCQGYFCRCRKQEIVVAKQEI